MELDEASKKKTAFRCFKRVFEFNVAGLGMKNVPSYFLYGISNIFSDQRKIVNSFFDDFIGHSKGKDQKDAIGNHIKDARIIFQRCKNNNIFLNLGKSIFFQPSVDAGISSIRKQANVAISIEWKIEWYTSP